MVRVRLIAAARRRAKAALYSGSAFTLLEVLLTLGLIGLLAGVLIVGAVQMTRSAPITAEDVFWKAVSESRKEALFSGHEVRLRFAMKNKSFALVSTGPGGEHQFPFEKMEDVKVDFLSTQKGGSAILIRSQLVETQTIPYVTFYGDGTCSPFRVQLRTGGPARTIAIDPWTCSPVLTVAENSR